MTINNILCFRYWKILILLCAFGTSTEAEEFETAYSVERPDDRMNLSLQISKDSQTGFPSMIRIAVENLSGEAIDLSYPQSIGPAIFSISYLRNSGSTRPAMLESGDTLLHEEVPPHEVSYWTYTMEELLEKASMTIDTIAPGSRLSIFARVRFFVAGEADASSDNRRTIAESFSFTDRL